jgi:hypothetical protein
MPEYVGAMGTESGGGKLESTGGVGIELESGGARESLGARAVSGPAELSDPQEVSEVRTANVASAHTGPEDRRRSYEFSIYKLCRATSYASVGGRVTLLILTSSSGPNGQTRHDRLYLRRPHTGLSVGSCQESRPAEALIRPSVTSYPSREVQELFRVRQVDAS